MSIRALYYVGCNCCGNPTDESLMGDSGAEARRNAKRSGWTYTRGAVGTPRQDYCPTCSTPGHTPDPVRCHPELFLRR